MMAILNSIEYGVSPKFPAFNSGMITKKVFGTVDKTSAIADDDVIIIARGIIPNNMVQKLVATNTALTGATDWDVIVCDEAGTELADSVSFATAKSVNILGSGVSGFSKGKSIAQLAEKGVDALEPDYCIAVVGNTVGAGTGTIQVEIEYSAPQ